MSIADLIATHDAEDAARDAQLSAARGEVQQTHNDLTIALGQRDALAAEATELTARVVDLEQQLAALQPVTLFGASIDGKTASGQSAMLAKWGPSAGRQFFEAMSNVAPRDPRLTRLHASWKPTLAAITDAAVRAACVNLLPGDVVEVWHEADAKVKAGTLTFADVVARKNAFHDAVKRVRPDLVVANTLTGWTLDPKSRSDVDRWGQVRADLLGADCDGIHSWPYPNYDDEIAAALAFLAKFPAYSGWCVPEFGTSRQPEDADGSVRAAWAAGYGVKFAAAGAQHVPLYEYPSTVGNAFTTPAELAAWSALI